MLFQWLDRYQKANENDALFIREGFTQGFSIQYTGPPGSCLATNLKSAVNNPAMVAAKLNKEIRLGRVAGPYARPPFPDLIVSPVGLVAKKSIGVHDEIQEEDFRLIHHLSFPEGDSINDYIDHEVSTVKYTSFDEVLNMILTLGNGAYMAKFDIKSAFRLIPVRQSDFKLLGIQFKDQFYFDKCLPFGCSISCSTFEKFSTFLEWTIKAVTASKNVRNYLDDFALAAFTGKGCQHTLDSALELLQDIGVPVAHNKTVQPTTSMTFLGINIDTVKREISMPQDKIGPLRDEIAAVLSAPTKKITLNKIQSLVGKLSFVCRAIPIGRAFLRRLIDAQRGGSRPHHRIRVTQGMREDLNLWQEFLQYHNGTTAFLDSDWTASTTAQLFTDAAGNCGFGAYFQGHWTNGRWPASWIDKGWTRDITMLELFPIVVAIKLWGERLKNKKVSFVCDNQAVVSIINKQTAKPKNVMSLLRRLILLCLQNNIRFKAVYIPTSKNVIADSLSRFQWSRFRDAAPQADTMASTVPPELWQI